MRQSLVGLLCRGDSLLVLDNIILDESSQMGLGLTLEGVVVGIEELLRPNERGDLIS